VGMAAIRWLVFQTVLRPLVLLDYFLRRLKLKPDRMYWADRLALRWGYFV